MAAARRRTRTRHDHWRWLELVDRDGPFVAIPALKQGWPQGIVPEEEPRDVIRDAKPAFDRAWDALQIARGDTDTALTEFRPARDTWIDQVLRSAFRWDGQLLLCADDGTGHAIAEQWPDAHSPDRRHTVRATGLFARDGERYAALLVVDPVTSLRDPGTDGWSASPIDRIELLLRTSGVPIGIVTDGRWWGIVSAQPGFMVASGIVDAQTWIEEPEVFTGIRALLDPECLASRTPESRLDALFRDSVDAAEEITEQLGAQVRQAVELLVAAFSDASLHDAGEEDGPVLPEDPDQVYQAAVTTMMRVVFLLFAEERDLMPTSALYTEGYAMTGMLETLEKRSTEEGGQSLDATSRTWHRLLATSRALYSGVSTEDMRLPAYGGSLFDPDRFWFLTAVGSNGLRIQVSDRVMLEVLRALQRAEIGGERRPISFRDIDVEQIGYIYEGLLGYSAVIVETTTLGLIGGARSTGAEPEIPLDQLDDFAEEADGDDETFAADIVDWAKKDQPGSKPPTKKQLLKALAAGDQLAEAEALLHAATRDAGLRTRLRPYVGIIRRDLRGRLLVIEQGGLVVVETPSRATSGAHYTPKALAQEVVQHALEPLVYSPGPYQTSDRSSWVPLRSNQILELKIADIACGSGAFLVSAAEYLADRLVEAYQREGVAQGGAIEQRRSALREVVATCLYGADINAMAVEMCKLSLWLVSLDPTKPFSFVDDKILCGNSLLGITDEANLRAIDLDPSTARSQADAPQMFATWNPERFLDPLDVDGILRDAADLRRRLASPVDDTDPQRAAKTKRRLWDEYQEKVETLLCVADGIISTGLRTGGKPGKRRDEAFEELREAVDRAFAQEGHHDATMLDALVEEGLTPEVETDYERWQPLHWAISVPDVIRHGGFDAIIGNPPFLGGRKLSGAMGSNVRDWLVDVVANSQRGSADLVAYFFLRAMALLGPNGTLGLIATNSVAQGDTREVGLDRMEESGFTITRAIRSRHWPSKSANLEYAAVWGTRGQVSPHVPRDADGSAVPKISTLLEPAGRAVGAPIRLFENRHLAFIGCYVLGMGFVVEKDEARVWTDEMPKNSEVLFPYLNGEDLNSRPAADASRWVIDFNDLTAQEAAKYSAPFERLTEQVKPERASKAEPVSSAPWWIFWNRRPALRKAIDRLDEVLAIALVSKTVMPARVSTGQVFSHALGVFATASFSDQALLSSSLHQLWAIRFGSGLRNDPRYTPSDVFETFPRAHGTDALDKIGRTLDEERREIMLRRDLGLTKLYNLVNNPDVHDEDDPDVARMRQIHVDLDNTVMEAYGWDDVDLGHGFHTYRQMQRWTVSPEARVEILDRLLEENHRRAAQESRTSEGSNTVPAGAGDDLEDVEAEGTEQP
ncbi:SAM-dependent DNA methyltransferase [Brachybacterium halotolerans subsp. kimchii]|uniref:Eco57I restriction-modification methylase domain-containing protein n=1 Tax=Brachybacterium halotolerans TaxID=2795215 RepID=UPI001E3DA839|nr:DNA methyltransferase [Brachybacterium halotolerans]UEJ81853.1 SAM-dependent DNA methyltransferase [Brachybacterium halotolerans subsp. kimchii]